MCRLPGVTPWASIPGKCTDAGAGGGDGDIRVHYWLKRLASLFLPWTLPPGPACRGEPWCCEACADGPPESTHPARCLRTESTPAEPGRWRSTASEGEEAPKRREKFSFVKLSLLFPLACLCRDCSERRVQLSVRGAGGGREGSTLTSVWMSWQRCSRIRLTEPKTSTLCSMCIMSIMLSMTINVPVLPTPALRRGNSRQLVTNTEHFVSRKHQVGAETFPLGAVAEASERV